MAGVSPPSVFVFRLSMCTRSAHQGGNRGDGYFYFIGCTEQREGRKKSNPPFPGDYFSMHLAGLMGISATLAYHDQSR